MELFLNGCRADAGAHPTGQDRMICILKAGEEDESLPGVQDLLAIRRREGAATRFESHDGFDYFSMVAADPAAPDAEPLRAEIWLGAPGLLLVHQGLPAARRLVEELEKTGEEVLPAKALFLFFAQLTRPDAAALEDIEEEISALEEALADQIPEGISGQIGQMRRRLLVLKRYYEGLFDALEDMEENANGLLDKKTLRLLHLQTNRTDRLRIAVMNLRDYVTQVREAYQNQVDLSLNDTMKLFTVITAVFLPLGLITGWYGMNLAMPELGWKYSYPVVIVLSVAVVVACLWVFKRKKWF